MSDTIKCNSKSVSDDLECEYKLKCTSRGWKCGSCANNTGKRDYYRFDVYPWPYPYVWPYTYPWPYTVTWDSHGTQITYTTSCSSTSSDYYKKE